MTQIVRRTNGLGYLVWMERGVCENGEVADGVMGPRCRLGGVEGSHVLGVAMVEGDSSEEAVPENHPHEM